MSTGFLLKSAPEADQLADRLEGGPWQGIELGLNTAHVASESALTRAIEVSQRALDRLDMVVTAEAPLAWPSGAFVSVDRLDEEARTGLERSAEFAAAVGSPVLTLHLFVPQAPDDFDRALDEEAVERFLRFYADTCLARGVTPLIENVPPVLRMRTGGVFLSPIGGHWRDLLHWRERVGELRFTLDTSHAGLFRSFAASYPTLFGLASDDGLDLARYVEELGPHAEVAHVSDAHGLLGEGLPYGRGELDLDPVVRRIVELVPHIVAEIAEPDHLRSVDMKAGYRALERAVVNRGRVALLRAAVPRVPVDDFDWQSVLGRGDPVPALLELQERFGGRRVLLTGGGGSIGRELTSFLLGFRPEHVTVVDGHEGSLITDRRGRPADVLERVSHVLCDIRDGERLARELARARPDVVFHLAAYKHVDWAEVYPDEFVDNNLHGSWSLLRAAEAAGVDTVVVASTDKAALAASFYGRTKRFMEQLTAYAGRSGGERVAVRFVNVLGSAGSASELFLAQARANVPLTVTDTGMTRFWITKAHAATLAAHGALLAGDGVRLATASEPTVLTVGELASRIWTQAGREGAPAIDLLGIRRGETLNEVLIAPGEELGAERHQGIAPIEGEASIAGAAWVAERLSANATREEARSVWLEAMRRPGLVASPRSA